MLIYVNITDRQTDRQTDGQTHQKYSSEPHKILDTNGARKCVIKIQTVNNFNDITKLKICLQNK